MVSPRDKEYNCSASPTDWILFVGSLWTIWTSWWIPELVEMATHRRGGMPLKRRLHIANTAVQWNCARILAPAYVTIMALARAGKPDEGAASYYFGYEPDYRAGAIPGITVWQWAKITFMDLPPLLLQPALFAYSNSLYRRDISTPLMAAHWVISSTPAAFTGLFLLVVSASPRLQAILKGTVALWLAGILAGVGLTFILIIYFLTEEGRALGWASAIPSALVWVLLMLPWQLKLCCGNLWHTLLYFVSAVMRMVPLLMDMATGDNRFPFCGANHVATIVVYAFFTGIFMWNVAFVGGLGVGKLCRQDWTNRRQAAEREMRARDEAERGDEEAVSPQSQEVLVQGDRDRV